MTEAEFLRRFDSHLVRIDEHIRQGNGHMRQGNEHLRRGSKLMARNNELFHRNLELMDEVREELRLGREDRADLKNFARELTRRSELVTQGMIAELAEMRDQTRANTNAVLQVLDRLNPPA